MRIEEIHDSGLFQDLVQALFIADRSEAFQVVDDSGGDAGLDGFDAEKSILYAFYCPRKPANDRQFREKALSDLSKAVRLRDEGGYSIQIFAFVTPQHVREPVVRALRSEAAKHSIDAISIGPKHLESMFIKHRSVQEQFPQLSYPEIQKSLKELTDTVNKLVVNSEQETLQLDEDHDQPEDGAPPDTHELRLFSGFGFPRIYTLQERLLDGDEDALLDLEQVRLETLNVDEHLAAIVTEIQFEGDRLNFARVKELAGQGITIALAADNRPCLGVLQAEWARALADDLVSKDMETAGQIAMGNRVGVQMVEDDERARITKQLESLENQIDSLFKDAMQNALSKPNLEAIILILFLYTNALAQRAFPFKFLVSIGQLDPDNESIEILKNRLERAYETAFSTINILEDISLLSIAYSNYANDLMVFDETNRARAHAQRALDLAEQLADENLIKCPAIILETLSREE